EKTYIGACAEARHAREAAAKAEQERRIRDAEQIADEQKKAATAQRRLTRAAVAVVIVVGVVAAVAIFQSRPASRAGRPAGVRQLAYQSRLNLEVRAPRNLLQALTFVAETRELDAFNLLESRQLLTDLLVATGGIPLRQEGPVGSVEYKDGRWVASVAD